MVTWWSRNTLLALCGGGLESKGIKLVTTGLHAQRTNNAIALLLAWTRCRTNSRGAGDLGQHDAHVTSLTWLTICRCSEASDNYAISIEKTWLFTTSYFSCHRAKCCVITQLPVYSRLVPGTCFIQVSNKNTWNKLHWNLKKKWITDENVFGNVVAKMAAILSQ